jgi:hypothetical protein
MTRAQSIVVLFAMLLAACRADDGALVGSVRSPYALSSFVDDDLVTTVVMDDAGVPYARVWRVGR